MSSALTTVAVLALSLVAVVSGAPSTPAPTFDNQAINVTYVDVVTRYIVQDLFTGPDQRFWPFLVNIKTALAPLGVMVEPQSSLAPGTVPATAAKATISLRRFSVGQYAIPFQSYGQYLVTVVHNGTQQHLANFIVAVNNGSVAATTGLIGAFYVPDINAVYSGATVAGSSNDGQLSLAWHILLVVGVVMVYAIALAAKYRQHISKHASRIEQTTTGGYRHDDENLEMHAKRWHTEDLDTSRQGLLQRASINSRNKSAAGRSKWFSAADKSAFVTDSQLAACEVALQEVTRNDALAVAAGTTTLDADEDDFARREDERDEAHALLTQRKKVNESWSINRINTLLEHDPQLRLPPQSTGTYTSSVKPTPKNARGVVLGSKARARLQRLEDEERRQQEAAMKRAQEQAAAEAEANGGGMLMDDENLSFELPPDELARIEQERAEEESARQIRQARPLGLAARRLARMMTTMAMDPSTVDPSFTLTSVHRSYSLGFNVPHESPMAHRRSLRAAKFVPHDTVVPVEGDGAHDESDHSPSMSPSQSPSPERGTTRVSVPAEATRVAPPVNVDAHEEDDFADALAPTKRKTVAFDDSDL